MLSAFKYRIYPKPEQEMRLKRSLFLSCELYNRLRAQKIEQYKLNGISLTLNNLRSLALDERRCVPELQVVYSQVALTIADRVHFAFKSFFEGRARFPRHKQQNKVFSMTYPQSGFRINPDKGLYLSGFGYIRIFVHRPLLGRIKRLTIKLEAGEWYAIFITNRVPPFKPSVQTVSDDRIRGADLGLLNFVTLDSSQSLEYPEFLRKSKCKLDELHRRLAHKKKGSSRWKRICFSLAKLHLHIKRQREDFQNKLVSSIFAQNDILILEKLNIINMLRNHGLAMSISDASWSQFARKANFKAEMLGKHFIAVDPWGTTQYCYACLTWVPKDLAEREHKCPSCGIIIARDLNSGLLIKRLGILSARSPPSDGGSSLVEPRPLPSLRGMVNRGVEARSHRS